MNTDNIQTNTPVPFDPEIYSQHSRSVLAFRRYIILVENKQLPRPTTSHDMCSSQCAFHEVSRQHFVCKKTGSFHLCTADTCNRRVVLSTSEVCPLTAFSYEPEYRPHRAQKGENPGYSVEKRYKHRTQVKERVAAASVISSISNTFPGDAQHTFARLMNSETRGRHIAKVSGWKLPPNVNPITLVSQTVRDNSRRMGVIYGEICLEAWKLVVSTGALYKRVQHRLKFFSVCIAILYEVEVDRKLSHITPKEATQEEWCEFTRFVVLHRPPMKSQWFFCIQPSCTTTAVRVLHAAQRHATTMAHEPSVRRSLAKTAQKSKHSRVVSHTLDVTWMDM